MKVSFCWEPRERNEIADKLSSLEHTYTTFCKTEDLLDLAIAIHEVSNLITANSLTTQMVESESQFEEHFTGGVLLSENNFFYTKEHSSRTLLLTMLGYLAIEPSFRSCMNISLMESLMLDEDVYFMDLVAARASKLFMSGSELHKFVCFPDGCVRADNEKAIRIGKTKMRNFGRITIG